MTQPLSALNESECVYNACVCLKGFSHEYSLTRGKMGEKRERMTLRDPRKSMR